MNLLSIYIVILISIIILHYFYQDARASDIPEYLPVPDIGNRTLQLFSEINPPDQNRQEGQIKLRLFDANSNQTIEHTTYLLTVTKKNERLMKDLFHSHSGELTIIIKPTNTLGKWKIHGEMEPIIGGWMTADNQIHVDAPIFLEKGLYNFDILIVTIDNDRNIFLNTEVSPEFESKFRICSDDLISVKKLSKDTTVCVKPETAEKLVERGWTKKNTKIETKVGIEIPCSKDSHLHRKNLSEKDTKQGYVSGELIVVLRELSQGNGISLHDRMAKIISNYDQVMIWESKLNPTSGICVPENEEQKYVDLLKSNEDVKSVGLNAIGKAG